MAAPTEVTNTVKEITPNAGLKIVQAFTGAMSDTNVTKITLADYGISKVYNVLTQAHDTENSILVTEAATTAVSDGVLTVTVLSASDTKKRSILIFGE